MNGHMRLRSITQRALVLAVAAVLAASSTAFAEPAQTTDTPAVTPPAPQAPSPSAIPVPVDPRTKAFRDELALRQARMDGFRSQLDELDRQLGIAAEAYNAAQADLEAIERQLTATHDDLSAAEVALGTQQNLLATRVEAMYRDGELSVAEILLDSRSIPDFFQRIEFIRTISQADAQVADQLDNQREQIAGQEIDLKTAEIQARALEFALKARKVEIELRIAERQAMLASAQNDLIALLDTEAAQRAGEELKLWREIIAGAGTAGVTVEAGAPVETALAYHGIPYVWAGASPSGFDCSGLTMYVMRQHGVNLPHHAASQYLLGDRVAPGDLKPGDLVFFGSPVYHVGMYVGGGYFVHAPRTGDYIKVSRLADRTDFVGARRYAWRYRVGSPAGIAPAASPALTVGR
jgi:cell wall-associated NlpC family hydrolase